MTVFNEKFESCHVKTKITSHILSKTKLEEDKPQTISCDTAKNALELLKEMPTAIVSI